jgi:large subunit ribosomal protein L3
MTQVYDQQGNLIPVSVIQAGPCCITQVKTEETDGYNAIQIGYDNIKKSRIKKPSEGHAKKANTTPKKFTRELRLLNTGQSEYKIGETLTVDVFKEIEKVDVTGVSKGKGFAGPMKRYHFAGFPASHGTERKHRAPGSQAGYGTDRGHGGNIKKGKRMGGHMGHVRITSKNHKVVSIDKENNLIVVKGPVAGAAGGYVIVKSSKTKIKL